MICWKLDRVKLSDRSLVLDEWLYVIVIKGKYYTELLRYNES